MTTKENAMLKEMSDIIKNINVAVRNHKDSIDTKVNKLETQVIEKHNPLNLERDILSSAQSAINESIKSVLTGYNSPLSKLVTSVIDSHSSELRKIIDDSFTSVIQTAQFKESIVEAFSHKVARTIISNNDGLFDKVSNELKQDAIFKSKMSIAVSNVVEECLKNRA